MMLREGEGLTAGPDIPGCMKYLTRAASTGHVRSLNFLAHALFDHESWLGHYSRVKIAGYNHSESDHKRPWWAIDRKKRRIDVIECFNRF